MTVGYDLADVRDLAPEWDAFEWRAPETYNIASVSLAHDPKGVALRHVDLHGRRHAFTVGELDRASTVLAAHLRSLGVEAGDRVAVCLPQCPEHLVVHLAAYKLAAVTVPLSMLLGEETVRHQLSHSGAHALLIDADRRAELPDDVAEGVEYVLPLDPGENDYETAERALGGLAAVIDTDRDVEIAPDTALDDPAVILYTSGTSGHPKGVLQGHGYLLGSLPGYHCCYHLFTEEACREALVWTPSEWAWAGALFDVVFPTLAAGGTVLSTERRSGFDPSRALAHVERLSVTHAFLPPTALARMRTETDPGRFDLSSLEIVMSGGEKLLPAVFEWAEDALGATVNETYGQTEANMLVGNCQRYFEAKPGSMGRPYPGHDVAIVDEDGTEVSPGELGEIVIEPPDPVTLIEYWNDPDATAEKFTPDGRMRTGDLARRDESGYLWHAGRRDDLIITSGYRVSPLEVESALTDESRIADALVGGVPDPEQGNRVKAYVKLANGYEPSDSLAADLRSLVRERLGAHKTPDDIEFVESFPETRSGKADRDALFSD